MMIATYLTVTTIIIDQNIRLMTPMMCAWSSAQLVMPGEGLAERVERAGADIAEHDADRADRQLDDPVIAVAMRVRRGRDVFASGRFGGGRLSRLRSRERTMGHDDR